MGIYYAFHVQGVEILKKKNPTQNDWFKPRVINILAQISWSDASKRPKDKDRGKERCDEEGSGTAKSEAWGEVVPSGVLPQGVLAKRGTEEGSWEKTGVKGNPNQKCKNSKDKYCLFF